MNTLAARPYISPRTRALTQVENETRRLAYAIKSIACDSRDFDTAGLEMSRLIPGGPCWLVPIPDRNGNTDANAKLAAAIARYTPGAQLAAVIRRTAPVESQCDRHKLKLGPSPIAAHKFTRTDRWLTARPTYLVDNVTTSGHTLQAAHNALGFGTGLVFADANCHQNHCPPAALPFMNTDNTQTNVLPFGPVVFSYTRRQALADGIQIDASATAKEAGIKYPLFITRAVWQSFVTVPPDVEAQDEAGRLYDIVWMTRFAIIRSRPGVDRLPVALYVRNDNQRSRLIRLVAVCGPLDIDDPAPAITVMLPDED